LEEGCPFYLSGGTALSGFYLQHRYSDDLDFFTRDREGLRAPGRYVEQAVAAAGLQIERIVPRGDLVQYFFSGDHTPTILSSRASWSSILRHTSRTLIASMASSSTTC
jgi:Nucleotidyl transferase AbiEii toxin, Type IV TA system